MCLFVSEIVCLSISAFCLSDIQYIVCLSLSICLPVRLYLSFCLIYFVCRSIWLSVYLNVYLSLSVWVLSVCLWVFTCWSIYFNMFIDRLCSFHLPINRKYAISLRWTTSWSLVPALHGRIILLRSSANSTAALASASRKTRSRASSLTDPLSEQCDVPTRIKGKKMENQGWIWITDEWGDEAKIEVGRKRKTCW